MTSAERDALAVQYLPLVRRIARGFQPATRADCDDLVSAGTLALVRASQHFDPDKGIQFIGYAWKAIRCEMLRELFARPQERAKPALLFPVGDDDVHARERRELDADERELLERALRSVPRRHRAVLELRYLRGLTMEQAGARFGVSRQRVQQIERKGLARLRRFLTAAKPEWASCLAGASG